MIDDQAFARLHADGRQAVLTGTHQAEQAPAGGGPRWAAGAVLRPDPRAARAIEQAARAAATVVGANHWLAGGARSSHLSVRRHLERRRRPITAGDRLVARYAAALRAAAKSAGPVRAADDLAAWTEARQQMKVTDVRVTEMQVVRWQYTSTGMMPVVLASASLP